ncbi:MAG: hypothetical protein Hyperionvirus28_18 [Hyperionvirus sp.]|uniref:Uncharacterized protein n=1 Tax=Hyperionvirus sp. TaxID=2487770 RepID=A0A3G5ABF3_9VIRU|nr:MAG: hypothetical protein Hyperionvirus28_18 [Hyperionvirus sp.]
MSRNILLCGAGAIALCAVGGAVAGMGSRYGKNDTCELACNGTNRCMVCTKRSREIKRAGGSGAALGGGISAIVAGGLAVIGFFVSRYQKAKN